MALVTISSPTVTASVIRGDIMRPLVGAWTADVVIDQPDGTGFDPGTKVTIQTDTGYSISGVVDPNRQGDFLDAVHVRVIGGAGGMLKAASARNYVQPGAYVRDVLNGLCTDGGETLSSTADAGIVGTSLPAWTVIGGNTIARNLKWLLEVVAPSANWRILADGTLWIGNETWPAASATFDQLWQDPADQSWHIGSDAPFIAPGTNLDGVGNVSRVLDTIADGKMRSRVWVDIPGTDRGINNATQQMAKQALPGVDYSAQYLCQIASQASDLSSVDISPVNDRSKAILGSGLQRVPAYYLTGVQVQVSPGATCLLGWDGGDPRYPYALIMSGGSALTAKILGNDPLITKADFQALMASLASITYNPGPGTPTTLTYSVPLPSSYGSTKVGAGR